MRSLLILRDISRKMNKYVLKSKYRAEIWSSMTIVRKGQKLEEVNLLSQIELDRLIRTGRIKGPYTQDEIRSMLVENSADSLYDVKENVLSGVPLTDEQLELLIRKNNLPDSLYDDIAGPGKDSYVGSIEGEFAELATGIRRSNVRATQRARILAPPDIGISL